MERALRVSPGYITKYEEQSPACSPMRALAPALPIPWAFPPLPRFSLHQRAPNSPSLAPNCLLARQILGLQIAILEP
jgi:hypothetical protein